MPFLNLGIGILYQKPKKEPPKLFSFMSPLAVEVWVIFHSFISLVPLNALIYLFLSS